MAPPNLGKSVNPISTKGGSLCPLNNTGTPGFSDLLTALLLYIPAYYVNANSSYKIFLASWNGIFVNQYAAELSTKCVYLVYISFC
jgi:hypothetical protein